MSLCSYTGSSLPAYDLTCCFVLCRTAVVRRFSPLMPPRCCIDHEQRCRPRPGSPSTPARQGSEGRLGGACQQLQGVLHLPSIDQGQMIQTLDIGEPRPVVGLTDHGVVAVGHEAPDP